MAAHYLTGDEVSLRRTFFTSCVVLGALGAAGYFIVTGSNQPAPRIEGELATKSLPTPGDSDDCLSEDCWIYRDSRLHCASPEDARRYHDGDKEEARCRSVSYVCVVSDCAPEHEVRSRDSFLDTIAAIGDRTWRQWALRHQDPGDKGARFRLTLDEDGGLTRTDTLVSSGSHDFDEAAIEAIRQTAPFTELGSVEPEVRVLMRNIILTFGKPPGPWREESLGSR